MFCAKLMLWVNTCTLAQLLPFVRAFHPFSSHPARLPARMPAAALPRPNYKLFENAKLPLSGAKSASQVKTPRRAALKNESDVQIGARRLKVRRRACRPENSNPRTFSGAKVKSQPRRQTMAEEHSCIRMQPPLYAIRCSAAAAVPEPVSTLVPAIPGRAPAFSPACGADLLRAVCVYNLAPATGGRGYP